MFTTFYIPKSLRNQLGNPYYVPSDLIDAFQGTEETVQQRMEVIRLRNGMTAPNPTMQQEQRSDMALALMTVGVITSVIGLGLQIASFRRTGG